MDIKKDYSQYPFLGLSSPGVNAGQQPTINPVNPAQQTSFSGIPKEAHDKFAQGGVQGFDASKCDPSKPDTRTEEKGQKLYELY
jgi:hypothetical protein